MNNPVSFCTQSRLLLSLACCAAFVLASHGADVSSDALKQQIVAQARTVSPDDYAFTRTSRVEQIEASKTEQRITIDRYDPKKPADQRWTLVSVDGRAPTAEEAKEYNKASARRIVPSYGRLARWFGAAATDSVDGRGRTTFQFASLPAETVVLSGSDLSASATGEGSVNTSGATPFVEQIRYVLTKPVRLKLVAKVERFEGTTRYRLMLDGKPFPAEQRSQMSGSMLGKTGSVRSTTTFSDVRAAGS